MCVCVCVDQPGHERIHKRASSRPAGQINRPAVRRTAGHRRRGGRTRRRPALFNASTATTRRRDGRRRRRRRLPPAAPRPATPWLAVRPPARRSVGRSVGLPSNYVCRLSPAHDRRQQYSRRACPRLDTSTMPSRPPPPPPVSTDMLYFPCGGGGVDRLLPPRETVRINIGRESQSGGRRSIPSYLDRQARMTQNLRAQYTGRQPRDVSVH